MTKFVRYTETGEVTEWGDMPSFGINYEIHNGRRTAHGGGGPEFWVDVETRLVHPKTENPAYLDEVAMVIRNVPNPSWVSVDRRRELCDDGEVELEFNQPGTYEVIVSPLRHLPKTFTVVIP